MSDRSPKLPEPKPITVDVKKTAVLFVHRQSALEQSRTALTIG